MAKKKKVKKAKKKKVNQTAVMKGKSDFIQVERTAIIRIAVNKMSKAGAEKVVQKKLGVSILPDGAPLSTCRVKTHGTFNMGDYNSIQTSVEIDDKTLAHPTARKALLETLTEEALEHNVKAAHKTAMKLFNRDIR